MNLYLQHFSRRGFHKMLHSFVITGVWHIPLKIINFLLRCTVTRNIHFFIAYNKLIALKDSKTALDMKCCSPIFIIRSVIRKHQIKQITGPSVTYDVFPLELPGDRTTILHSLKPAFSLCHRSVAFRIASVAALSGLPLSVCAHLHVLALLCPAVRADNLVEGPVHGGQDISRPIALYRSRNARPTAPTSSINATAHTVIHVLRPASTCLV